jgi:hypothetical protein
MNVLTPLITLLGTLGASCAAGLFLQWLTLHALFQVFPGRKALGVAQVAVQRTRRVVLERR